MFHRRILIIPRRAKRAMRARLFVVRNMGIFSVLGLVSPGASCPEWAFCAPCGLRLLVRL